MNKLSEANFKAIKDEIKEGRLTMSGMRAYLIGLFFISGLFVGVSLAVANANTVGWDTLSTAWHRIYYAEAVLFGFHLLVMLFFWWNNAFTQKMLSIAVVLFTYKAAMDPFITVLMFSKDRGMYELYLPFILIILVGGLIIHIIVLVKWFNSLRSTVKTNEKSSKKRKKNYILFPILFIIIAITSMAIKNGLLGNFEIVFMAFIITIVYLGLLIAACEFIIAMYCIFKFPSFSVKNFNEK
ncbi:hypothetical protein [Oceanobacillus sp. FSL H7-0719]|uniref:hypothetical protein n=1 Tax=Oceanobacillus sp. FSL H7-0719 TaxID=2954507 RepID=UPI003250C25E